MAYNNDKLWKKFFLLRSSPGFIKQWMAFLKLTGLAVKPVLFQHLTDKLFRKSLNDHFRINYLGTEDLELTEIEMLCRRRIFKANIRRGEPSI